MKCFRLRRGHQSSLLHLVLPCILSYPPLLRYFCVAVLVVFDSHSETDPFAGVRHWVRALRLAEHVQGNAVLHMKKFLVAARIDRGGKSVSRERIDALLQELGFDGYFETSAKEGHNIASLAEVM